MQNNVPVAYKGDQPYIFISYAHKDSDIVLPIISRLQQDGYEYNYRSSMASAIHMKGQNFMWHSRCR